LGVPGRPLVDRAEDPGGDSGERIELLDGRVGAVGDERARVEERAIGVRAGCEVTPEAVGEVPVGGGVAELNRRDDTKSGEALEVHRVEELRVLDAGP